jgi:hypothetical protein
MLNLPQVLECGRFKYILSKTLKREGLNMYYVLIQLSSLSKQEERGAYETEKEALEEAIECLRSGYIVELVEE